MQEPVDVSSLVLLRQLQEPGKPDVVARIISRFLEETDERVGALRSATESGDSEKLENAAHALVGIAGTVGANEILKLALSLEHIGRDGRTGSGDERDRRRLARVWRCASRHARDAGRRMAGHPERNTREVNRKVERR